MILYNTTHQEKLQLPVIHTVKEDMRQEFLTYILKNSDWNLPPYWSKEDEYEFIIE